MARTIIEEPDSTERVVHEHVVNSDGGGMGIIIGGVILLIVVILFFYYGLPYIRSMSSPQVNVPDHVDVNVNSTK